MPVRLEPATLRSQVKHSTTAPFAYNEVVKDIKLYFLTIDFVLANSTDPVEMQHFVAFHLGLSLFAKVHI